MPKMIAIRPLTGSFRSDQRPHLLTVPPKDTFDCSEEVARDLASRGLAEYYLPEPPEVVVKVLRKPLPVDNKAEEPPENKSTKDKPAPQPKAKRRR